MAMTDELRNPDDIRALSPELDIDRLAQIIIAAQDLVDAGTIMSNGVDEQAGVDQTVFDEAVENANDALDQLDEASSFLARVINAMGSDGLERAMATATSEDPAAAAALARLTAGKGLLDVLRSGLQKVAVSDVDDDGAPTDSKPTQFTIRQNDNTELGAKYLIAAGAAEIFVATQCMNDPATLEGRAAVLLGIGAVRLPPDVIPAPSVVAAEAIPVA